MMVRNVILIFYDIKYFYITFIYIKIFIEYLQTESKDKYVLA